jgi:hypothetical protein
MRQRRRLPGRTPPPRRAPNPGRAGLEPRASSSGWLVCGHVLTPPNPSGDENAAAVPPADAPPAVTRAVVGDRSPWTGTPDPWPSRPSRHRDRCDDRPLSLGARSERSLGRVPAISFPELRPSTIGPRHLAVVAAIGLAPFGQGSDVGWMVAAGVRNDLGTVCEDSGDRGSRMAKAGLRMRGRVECRPGAEGIALRTWSVVGHGPAVQARLGWRSVPAPVARRREQPMRMA